jgi:hypothetical protein
MEVDHIGISLEENQAISGANSDVLIDLCTPFQIHHAERKGPLIYSTYDLTRN